MKNSQLMQPSCHRPDEYVNSSREQRPMLHFSKMGFPAEGDPSSCMDAIMWFLVSKRVCKGHYNTILSLPKIGSIRKHRDIPYIVSGTTPILALLLVHFSQCLFERIFFSFWRKQGNERSNFFFIFEILKRSFRKKNKKN